MQCVVFSPFACPPRNSSFNTLWMSSMAEMTEVMQNHTMLSKVLDDQEQLRAVCQFVRWLREENHLEICELNHVSYTDKKVFVKSSVKPEWLIADFFHLDLRKLDVELKIHKHLGESFPATADDLIRLHGEKMLDQLTAVFASIRKITSKS